MNVSRETVLEALTPVNFAFESGWIDDVEWLGSGVAFLRSTTGSGQMLRRVEAGIVLHSAARVLRSDASAEARRVVEELVAEAAGDLGGPPLTHADYWCVENPPNFTGSAGEVEFRAMILQQVDLREQANELLRDVISEGPGRIGSADASRALDEVTDLFAAGQSVYREAYRGTEERPRLTPAQFLAMREWLGAISVGGRTYLGPNAAAIGAMVGTEELVGTADDEFRAYADGFAEYQTPDERRQVLKDLTGPSVLDVLAEAMGDDVGRDLAAADDGEVACALGVDRGLLLTVKAALRAHRAFYGQSGAHLGRIHSHLIRPSQLLSDDEKARMAVSPDSGVGGHSHQATRALHDRRRNHAGYATLNRALRLINEDVA